MRHPGSYPSTDALSVYNVLSLLGRDLSDGEILAYLREHFDEAFPESALVTGIDFLVARGFVERRTQGIAVKRIKQGSKVRAAHPLRRTRDRRELVYG
jgi:hypothetical protein